MYSYISVPDGKHPNDFPKAILERTSTVKNWATAARSNVSWPSMYWKRFLIMPSISASRLALSFPEYYQCLASGRQALDQKDLRTPRVNWFFKVSWRASSVVEKTLSWPGSRAIAGYQLPFFHARFSLILFQKATLSVVRRFGPSRAIDSAPPYAFMTSRDFSWRSPASVLRKTHSSEKSASNGPRKCLSRQYIRSRLRTR
jgi:hypothetical protein